MRIFGFAGHQNYDSPAFAKAVASRQSATGSPAASANPRLLETILLQTTVECTSAQPKRLCCFTRVAVVSGQCFLDEECLYFFKTHLLEIARFTAVVRQAKVASADLSILRHKHGTFDDMIELSNISRKAML
jgi:hypothetical protein